MSFTADLSVGEKVFVATGQPGIRIEQTSTLAEPDILTISHEVIKPTATRVARDGHLVKNSVTIIDANDIPQVLNVYVRLDVPRSTAIPLSAIRLAVAAVFGVFLADDFPMNGLTTANQEGVDGLSNLLLGLS